MPITSIFARVALLSAALLFFTVPHVLEDFALGEPQSRGVPAAAIASVISLLLATQGVGLYWLGQGRRRGLWIHVAIGCLWPSAAGLAQLPEILSEAPYRSGWISIVYVLGILSVGISLTLASVVGLRRPSA